MNEIHIYRNNKLHCIVNAVKAEATLELLRDCYSEDSWAIKEPRSWLDILTAIVLITASLYIGGHLIWFFRTEIMAAALVVLWAAVRIWVLF